MPVARVAAAVVVRSGVGRGGQCGEGPYVAGGGQSLVLHLSLHDHQALAGRPGDRGGTGVGAQVAGIGEAGTIIADLAEDPGPGQCAQTGKAGQDRRVGMLVEDALGFGRELVSRLAGRIELQEQTTCLFTEYSFHTWQLA